MFDLRAVLLHAAAFLIILAAATPAAAVEPIADCMKSAEHDSVTYLLIDRSEKLEDTANLQQSLSVVLKMVEPAERLIVGVSTGESSSTRVIMDVVKPKESLWVSRLKIRAAQKQFDDCFGKMTQAVLEQNESYKTSALLETLNVVSKALAADESGRKRVILFSDMVQNSPAISFYRQAQVNPESTLKAAEKERLVTSFPAVEFHVAGAGAGVSGSKARSIEEFWKQYIERSGGTLKFYGPVLFAS